MRARGLEFYAVNSNHPEDFYEGEDTPTSPRKLKADLFIDDRNLGGLPDWGVIYHVITEGITFRDYYLSHSTSPSPTRRKSLWPWSGK